MAAENADRALEIRERIRGNFDRAAGVYADFEAERFFFRSLVGELLNEAPLLEGARVLDVGCGTGASLRVLAERVGPEGACVGLDISLGMLGEARARLGEGASLVLLDACAFERAFRSRFRAVVYNAVLHMLPDVPASLACARSVLEPSGTVLASYLDRTAASHGGGSLTELLQARGYATGRHAVATWESIEEALRALFEDVRVREVSIELKPGDVLGFYGMGPMCAALLPKLPPSERLRVLQELMEEWKGEGRTLTQVWKLASARAPGASA